MDSIKSGDGMSMRIWKGLFGGDNLFGRMKLYLFLAAYILIGGFTLAQFA